MGLYTILRSFNNIGHTILYRSYPWEIVTVVRRSGLTCVANCAVNRLRFLRLRKLSYYGLKDEAWNDLIPWCLGNCTSASCYGIRTRSTYRDLIRSMAIPKCFYNSSPCKAMFDSCQPKCTPIPMLQVGCKVRSRAQTSSW